MRLQQVNSFSSLCFAMYLPLATHTGLVDTWHSPGPPGFVRMLLASIFAGACTFKAFPSLKAFHRAEDLLWTGVVFGKACLCMSLYVWVRDWWSLAERCENHRVLAPTPHSLPKRVAEVREF